jgi:hypothetical protein
MVSSYTLMAYMSMTHDNFSNALRAVGCTLGCTDFDQALAHKVGLHHLSVRAVRVAMWRVATSTQMVWTRCWCRLCLSQSAGRLLGCLFDGIKPRFALRA